GGAEATSAGRLLIVVNDGGDGESAWPFSHRNAYARSVGKHVVPLLPGPRFQSHLILVGRSRLQVEVGGCRFVCSQCWFEVPDRRNQSRSKNAMIAGPGHFDCRSLQLAVKRFLSGRGV
ncbi:hypothetical protein F4W70_29180, partial [Pseudomonas cannabina]